MHSIPGRRVILSLFLIFLLLPIYWLINMSFKTNTEITTSMSLIPLAPTLENIRSTIPNRHDRAGTQEPTCAMSTMSATWRM